MTDQADSASHLRLHHHADKTKRDTDYICEWCGEVDTDAMRNAITTSRTRAEKAERKADTLTARLAAVEALAEGAECADPVFSQTCLELESEPMYWCLPCALRAALDTGQTLSARFPAELRERILGEAVGRRGEFWGDLERNASGQPVSLRIVDFEVKDEAALPVPPSEVKGILRDAGWTLDQWLESRGV